MENAVEGLKMAGAVLLFILALSITMLSFSQAREAIDAIVAFSDRESLVIEGDSRFFYLSDGANKNRTVGLETIIPTIYRAYKENYQIVFKFNDLKYYLFKEINPTTGIVGTNPGICKIDLEEQQISSDLASKQFLDGIIYGNYKYEDGKNLEDWEDKFYIKPNVTSLFDYINKYNKNITESLGTYYMEDVVRISSGSVEDVNKTEKRVITYTFPN